MNPSFWAGVDVGGTKTAVVLSADPPHLLNRVEFATAPERGPGHALERVQAILHEMLAAEHVSSAHLQAIGISCGGPLDRTLGVVHAPPNLPTWIDLPIVKILADAFGCPVTIENDANACAVAEHRFGAGRGSRNMVFLTMGTGLGAGLILDNRLYNGTNDNAGEIGHVRLTRQGPVGFHKEGSVEGWASGGGLAQIAARALQQAHRRGQKSTLLSPGLQRTVTAREVGLAAQAGDGVARNIVRTSGRKLGLALAMLVDILNPECIVIGGLAMRLGELLLEPARKVLEQEALLPALKVCRVVPAQLGESIGDVAALAVAMGARQIGTTKGAGE